MLVFSIKKNNHFLNAWLVLNKPKPKPRSAMTSLGRFSRKGLREAVRGRLGVECD